MCPAPWRAPVPTLVPGDNWQVKARASLFSESFTINVLFFMWKVKSRASHFCSFEMLRQFL